MKTRKSNIRLKNHDYSLNGYYFVTVCAKDRKNIFGDYKNVGAPLACARYNDHDNNHINLTQIGKIIDNQWNDIPNRYNNIILDQYIIMPNHIHGILIINNCLNELSRAQASGAPTIGQIIRSFKSKSTLEYVKHINDNNLNISGKIWQRLFYDHIIRNDKSLHKIREYIINNPSTWDTDENNPGHNQSL